VLIDRGLLHGDADGVWGPETREAITAYQRQQGIAMTGSIDMPTVSSLGVSSRLSQQANQSIESQSSSTGAQTSTSTQTTTGQGQSGQTGQPSSQQNATGQTPNQNSGQAQNPTSSTTGQSVENDGSG
jgi:peptidoglycan hydrolase-like protein with peptidoglycan-binding domain